MFFHTLVCPYQHFSMIERRYSPPEKTSVKTNCPLNCTLNPTIDVEISENGREILQKWMFINPQLKVGTAREVSGDSGEFIGEEIF